MAQIIKIVKSVNYKKYFYALRSLFAGKYIQRYQCPPPVLFEELMNSIYMPSDLRNGIKVLLEIKKRVMRKNRGYRFRLSMISS